MSAMTHPTIYARLHPHKAAVISYHSGAVLTYGDMELLASRIAQFFRAQDLVWGDAVAIAVGNDLRLFPIVWAALRCGLYMVPVSSTATATEIGYLVENSEAKILIAARPVAERLEGLVPQTLRAGFVLGDNLGDFVNFNIATQDCPTDPIVNPELGEIMFYSSGTTGRPKGIRRPLSPNEWNGVDARDTLFAKLFSIDSDTVYLSPAPLYHAAPLTFCLTVQRMGGTAVIMDRFDAEQALDAIETYRVTHSQWVPTMFSRLLSLPDDVRSKYDPSSQKVAIHAAAPCPPSVKRQMIDWWGPILTEYYAGSESVGFCYIRSEEWLLKPGSVGCPLNCEVHIVGEDGEEVERGAVGQIYFSGWPAFSYHKDEAKSLEARHPKGWSSMGDMGYLDDDGFLFLSDRKDFMILCGGVNIYPREVEDTLASHPAVLEACVLGAPHADLGEVPVAVVILSAGYEATPDLAADLKTFCVELLAKVKCPREVFFIAELPRTPVGKVLKSEVKQMLGTMKDAEAAPSLA